MISDKLLNHRLCLRLVGAACVALAIVAIYALLAFRASTKVLAQLATIKPGINLNTLRDKLGPELYVFGDVDSIVRAGSIKDERFCDGKKLFIFYSSMPPSRALEVYTDKDNVVVFVSWHHL